MTGVLVGLLTLVIGIAVCFAGLRLFFIMLPIWGFLAGFFLGAAGVSALFGDGFLQTTFGIIVGLVLGVIFALLSYFYWYFGVLLAAASFGAILGTGLMRAINLDANWFLFIIGVIFGAVFLVAALLLNLPVYIVLVNTAFAGAAAIIAGVLMVFQRIDVNEFRYGFAWGGQNTTALGMLWWIAWIVLAALGIGSQLNAIRRFESELPVERWAPAPAAKA